MSNIPRSQYLMTFALCTRQGLWIGLSLKSDWSIGPNKRPTTKPMLQIYSTYLVCVEPYYYTKGRPGLDVEMTLQVHPDNASPAHKSFKKNCSNQHNMIHVICIQEYVTSNFKNHLTFARRFIYKINSVLTR